MQKELTELICMLDVVIKVSSVIQGLIAVRLEEEKISPLNTGHSPVE